MVIPSISGNTFQIYWRICQWMKKYHHYDAIYVQVSTIVGSFMTFYSNTTHPHTTYYAFHMILKSVLFILIISTILLFRLVLVHHMDFNLKIDTLMAFKTENFLNHSPLDIRTETWYIRYSSVIRLMYHSVNLNIGTSKNVMTQ